MVEKREIVYMETTMKMRKIGGLLFVISMLALAGWAQEAKPASAAEPPPQKKTLFHMIRQGGWAMYFLGACSFGMITAVTLNFQRVNKAKMLPTKIIADLSSAASERDLDKMRQILSSNDSYFTRALAPALKYVNPEDPAGSKTKVETAIGEAIGREEAKYSYFVNFLSLLTSMSPMWGLLGTVSGMIGAFSKIGGGGMGKPELLAANIGEALICTATGLFIAIFSMFFYFFFRNNLNAIVKESEEHFSEILDHLLGVGFEADSSGEA